MEERNVNHSHPQFGLPPLKPDLSHRWQSGSRPLPWLALVTFWILVGAATDAIGQTVDFQRQVRPILAGKCFSCHGPDEEAREAELRLDRFDAATADREGSHAIVPGDHRASEIWVRMTTEDEDLRMPPTGKHSPLSPEQIETIARWIDQGAEYKAHWAFVPPTRPAVPIGVQADATPATPIDAFVDRRLAEAGLQPGKAADRYTLVRRLYLDLIGIPPTPQQADEFVNDASPVAYAKSVDTLLASPEYSQRWARPWLDLARYADTNGYEKDRPRTIWPYRDWVLGAINSDMPYDRFSILQLAGDALPDATDEDRVATGFHRNTMLNEEGGIDPQEFRFHAMNDRVATTGTVWLGMTIGCAQCHSHKYDPISHTDYYSLFAFLDEADDIEQEIPDPSVTQRRQELAAAIREREDTLINDYLATVIESELPSLPDPPPPAPSPPAAQPAKKPAEKPAEVQAEKPAEKQQPKPQAEPAPPPAAGPKPDQPPPKTPEQILAERKRDAADEYVRFLKSLRNNACDWEIFRPARMESTLPKLDLLADGSVLASGDVTKREVYRLHFEPLATGQSYAAIRLEALPHASLPAGGPGVAFYEGRRGDFFLSELELTLGGVPVKLHKASASYGKISIGSGSGDASNPLDKDGSTGWSTSGHEGEAERWVARFETPLKLDAPWAIEMIFERHFAAALGRFRISLAPAPNEPAPNEPAPNEPAIETTATAMPIGPDAEAAVYRWKLDPNQLPAADVIDQVRRKFIGQSETLREVRKPIEQLRNQMPEPVRTLVLRDRPVDHRRVTRLYHRGEYLNPRDPVTPAVPQLFAPYTDQPPTDRLGFAKWLVSPANPLFARVAVDRAWREFFGRGIVDTAGDYGTQSEPPSHPELIDYLATEFALGGMSIKRLHREIVLSDAYQRDSRTVEQARQIDPQNRLLASGPRRRMEAERVRDSLLAASGLLTRVWGGPGVFPPQPATVMQQAYGRPNWSESVGADRVRRSLYTYAKRTAPFAFSGVFDGPTGEACIPRRDVSNSPLQALTLLNDTMFQEIATALADDVIREDPAVPDEAMAGKIFRRVMTRPATPDELSAILAFHQSLDRSDPRLAWGLVARAVINLDEAISTP